MPDVSMAREEPAQPFWTRESQEDHRTAVPESMEMEPQDPPQAQEPVQAMAPLPTSGTCDGRDAGASWLRRRFRRWPMRSPRFSRPNR